MARMSATTGRRRGSSTGASAAASTGVVHGGIHWGHQGKAKEGDPGSDGHHEQRADDAPRVKALADTGTRGVSGG